MAESSFKFYNYDPSLPAAAIFVVVFGISALLHIWQMFRNRTWYFIPFLIGCLCKLQCRDQLARILA